MKLARAYQLAIGQPARHKVVRRSVSYHGNTLAALALSGRPNLQAPYRPLLAATPEAAAPFCYHCPLGKTYPECGVACADDLEATIEREGADTVAAFLAEPILGASAGAAVPPEDYARRVREICDRHGVLLRRRRGHDRLRAHGPLVRDGVERGAARPRHLRQGHERRLRARGGGAGEREGRGGAGQRRAASPTASRSRTTRSPPPPACATLDILERERLVERAAAMGEVLGRRLERLRAHPHVGDVRGRGLLWGVELVADKATRRPFPRARSARRRRWPRRRSRTAS